jgi:pyruvate dehydrogenase E2 component (dihydrolipoamide acetyltransferase)
MKTFHLPDLGEGLAEAEIREWYIKVGDEVKVDQPLVSMETAKAVVDVPSPYTGKIVELFGKPNDIIQTGAPLIKFQTEEGEQDNKTKGSVVGSLEESKSNWDEGEMIIGAPKKSGSAVKAMPAARVLAKEMNIDLSLVAPTGPSGLITPDDVRRANTSHQSNEVTLDETISGDIETLHGVRRTMAKTMAQSHREIVPVTIIEDADISHLSIKSDLTVHLLNAIVQAVKKEPALNAWFNGGSLERRLIKEVNIGLAVDSEEGLFVPVIKNAESRTSEDLRKNIDYFKTKLQSRSLSAEEMKGATITLSNFGMIAGRYATPIVVPPTVSILGCGRSRDVVLPKDDQIVIGRIVPLSLTFDHRAVTGGEATRFLRAVIDYLQA